MKRLMAIAFIFTLLAGFTAANTHTQLDKGPGMIGSDSPLYGLEIAFDNAAVSIGLAKAGGVAQERAAEAKAMQEKGNDKAAEKAANQMSKVAQKSKARDAEGLQKAEVVLQGVMENAPEEAREGLQTALDSVSQARERAQQARDKAGDQAPTDTPTQGEDAQQTADEKIAQAEQMREQGRQALDEGNNLLDEERYQEAKQKYQEAENYFSQAVAELDGVQTPESQTLQQRLQNSRSGADNLEQSVNAYMNGDNETADQYSQNAQEDFQQARGGR